MRYEEEYWERGSPPRRSWRSSRRTLWRYEVDDDEMTDGEAEEEEGEVISDKSFKVPVIFSRSKQGLVRISRVAEFWVNLFLEVVEAKEGAEVEEEERMEEGNWSAGRRSECERVWSNEGSEKE
jgi:hypothetical protein